MEMSDDIYANAETIRNIKSTSTPDQNPPTNPGEQHSGIRTYRLTAVCLGLLTVLLLIIITALCIYHNGVLNDTMEKHSTLSETLNQLQTNYSSLTAERDQLQTNYNSLTAERDQLQTNYSSLIVERDQLQAHFKSLVIAERDQEHPCPQDWLRLRSRCYYVSSEEKTWSASRQHCRERGADLVIINNEEEQTFFTSFRNIWIGLTDSEEEGTWKWVDGTAVTTRYWRSGQPDDYNNEDCVAIQPEKSILQSWNDFSCALKTHWVCEKP
ncbi:hypothetical protein AGOR_G00188680 [Albula goreensis]|uniref:C-type lectin domain-containing protein n=1 Tax=Albula goreensis TaxID=1534307 RepID=A0A8T3CSF6_9TELE|nr:hypothetical protein AGOR_G00188680 [Albula goreensis]